MINSNFNQLSNEDRQRVLNKLTKLKALSECATGNINETATAAAAMTRLMLEYQIEMAELNLAESAEEQAACSEEVTGEASQRGFPVWQTHLLSSLAEVNDCILYVQSAVVREPWQVRRTSTQRLIGSKQDIANTRSLFQFCLLEIDRLLKQWDRRAPQARRNDFRLGQLKELARRYALKDRRFWQKNVPERSRKASNQWRLPFLIKNYRAPKSWHKIWG